jgi:thiol-disulfide isomerase/thioredoxin
VRNVLSSIIFVFLALSGTQIAAQGAPLKVGDKAPRVAVHDLDGKSVDLGRYIGSTPVFLEFWATWCTSCQELAPHVRAARKAFHGKIEFIGINVAVNQSPTGVREYLSKHDPDFHTLYDDEGNSTRSYEVPATSYVVIIDRSGTIAYTGMGGTQNFDKVLGAVSE